MKHLLLLLFLFTSTPTHAQHITTIAGRLSVSGGDSCNNSGIGGMATNAVLRNCRGDICLDTAGNVFFSNMNGVMRIDAVTGIMMRVAGGGTDFGTVDTIPATSIGQEIRGLCFDADGYLLLAPSTSAVIRLNLTTGYFTPVAGVWGMGGYTGDGGPATAARMQAWKVRLDAAGNMYILDNWHSVVRKVDAATGIIRTIAGDGFASFTGDGGPATAGRFNRPEDMVLDSAGNIYIADRENFRVRKIDAVTGILSTVAGSGGPYTDTFGIGGMATAARISRVQCLAIDDTGYLYLGVGNSLTNKCVWNANITVEFGYRHNYFLG